MLLHWGIVHVVLYEVRKRSTRPTIECPHCGHDFLGAPKTDTPDWEYSLLADLALLMGAVASGLGAFGCAYLMCLYAFIAPIRWSDLWPFLIAGAIGFCVCSALLVVFLRVGNLGHRPVGWGRVIVSRVGCNDFLVRWPFRAISRQESTENAWKGRPPGS